MLLLIFSELNQRKFISCFCLKTQFVFPLTSPPVHAKCASSVSEVDRNHRLHSVLTFAHEVKTTLRICFNKTLGQFVF